MSAELREAAERLFGYATRKIGQDLSESARKAIEDMYLVSQSVINEHPSDENEFADDAWLVSQGFEYDDDLCGKCVRNKDGTPLCFQDDGSIRFGIVYTKIPMKNTKGEVRQLCKALGCTLKEQVSK